MPQPNPTFFEEALEAARGTWALVMGRRDAAQYFDFSIRGLVSSFIALVLAVAVIGIGPALTGAGAPPGGMTLSIIVNAVMVAAQIGIAWMVLQQMGRQDGFLPYLVANNWVNLFVALVVQASTFLGPLGIIIFFAVAVAAILIFVNVGRFIVTLSPAQIAILFVCEAVGVVLALGVTALMLPLPATV